MNNNRLDQNALLANGKGVFSTTGWINHGNADDPLPYIPKAADRESFKGKQFGVTATKTGKLPSSFFEPQHKYLAEGEKYVDRWPYAEQQHEKQKGFGTGDFSKRDEFALAIRMEQQREQLRHEARLQKAAEAKLGKKQLLPASAQALQGRAKREVPLLFDLVFNTHSQFSTKVKHDTLNPTALSKDRNYGPYKTMTAMAHAPPGVTAKPQFVHRPAIKEEFYRKTNVFFPNGCSAEPPRA